MCLHLEEFNETESPEPLIASEAIVVYKVLKKVGFGTRKYCSPYRNWKYLFGRVLTAELATEYQGSSWGDSYVTRWVVQDGFHSFASLADAKQEVCEWGPCDDYEVFVAIIPKGAEYFVGEYEGKIAYASNKFKALSHKHPDSVKLLQSIA